MKYRRHRFISVSDLPPARSVSLLAAATCLGVVGLCAWDNAHAHAPATPAPAKVTVAPANPVEAGAKVYGRWCVECHNSRGFGTVKLKERYQGSVPAVLDQRKDLNADLVKYIVRNGISFMPPFRKTEVTDSDLAALSAYLTTDPAKRSKAK